MDSANGAPTAVVRHNRKSVMSGDAMSKDKWNIVD